MLAAKVESSSFENIEPGTYIARCISVIDLGTKLNEWQGQVRSRHQMMLVWEIPAVRFTGDYEGPRTLSKFYTVSLSEKSNLFADLSSWRGKSLDQGESVEFKNLLDKPCMLSVINNDKGKNVISSVMKVMAGAECPPRENPLTYFDLSDFDLITYTGMSEGIQKMIAESDEYKAMDHSGGVQVPTENPAPAAGHVPTVMPPKPDLSDDIPF